MRRVELHGFWSTLSLPLIAHIGGCVLLMISAVANFYWLPLSPTGPLLTDFSASFLTICGCGCISVAMLRTASSASSASERTPDVLAQRVQT